MKNKFLLGAVSGVTALAVGFPILAQVSSAQDVSGPALESASSWRWAAERPVLTVDMLQEMIDRDQALLENIDEMVVALKSATQTHKDALTSALSLSDQTARDEAARAANEARRAALEAVIEANPDLKGLLPFGPGGRGGHGGMMRGPGPEKMAEVLGLTVDELQTALDSGQTIEQLAEEKGVILPEHPAFKGGKMGHGHRGNRGQSSLAE